MLRSLSNPGFTASPPTEQGEDAFGTEASVGERAFLALGSNLGNRLAHLREGVRFLIRDGRTRLVAVSSLYETEPLACAGGPFLNAVAVVRTILDPRGLLRVAKAAEREAGRTGSAHDARPLDVDILFHGTTVLHEADLTIPHPRWSQRPFVVVPLLEVCGETTNPASGRLVREEARGADSSGRCRRIEGPAWCDVAVGAPFGPWEGGR